TSNSRSLLYQQPLICIASSGDCLVLMISFKNVLSEENRNIFCVLNLSNTMNFPSYHINLYIPPTKLSSFSLSSINSMLSTKSLTSNFPNTSSLSTYIISLNSVCLSVQPIVETKINIY